MFLPSTFKCSVGLANVCGVGGAGACIFVDPFFLVGVRLGFVAAAEDVFEFGC